MLAVFVLFLRIHTIKSEYSGKETQIEGILLSYQVDGNLLKAEVKAKEKILVQYYFTSEQEKLNFETQYHLGDQIEVQGNLEFPPSNRNFHLFDYQKYLKSKKIFWLMEGNQIVRRNSNQNLFFTWKEWIYQKMDQRKNAVYLKYFLLGNSNQIDSSFLEEIQLLGISHLFAISGMHVHLLIGCILWILKKITNTKWIQLFFIISFLIFYSFLTNFSPSIIRASLFFIFLFLKKAWNLPIPSLFCLVLIWLVMLYYNPYYCYHLGFVFSFTISFSLLYFSRYQKKQSYLKQLWQTSWISFLMGIPILIHNFFQINFLTPIWNLFFVPFVSFLLFPTCIACLFLPILNPFFDILISILKWFVEFGNQISCLQFPFSFISWTVMIGYWLIIVVIIQSYLKGNYKILLLLPIILFFHYHIAYFNPYPILTMIDVGQGDSILLVLPRQKGTILVDTGGIVTYEKEKWKQRKKEYSIANSILIPYLRSIGIHHLDYLILTHGDVDHMKEAGTLIEHFPVKNIVMNSGNDNDLELHLSYQAITKNIPIISMAQGELKVGDQILYFLNQENSKNENEDSLIVYTKMNKLNILLMGDAGTESEEQLLSYYHLPQIDVLKVGHHGSKSGTSKIFLDTLLPKYALISAGVSNRFGHPNFEVLERLRASGSMIYNTNTYGMIQLILKEPIKVKTRYFDR